MFPDDRARYKIGCRKKKRSRRYSDHGKNEMSQPAAKALRPEVKRKMGRKLNRFHFGFVQCGLLHIFGVLICNISIFLFSKTN